MTKKFYIKKLGFLKSFSTGHAVISFIQNIEKAIDNIACGIFVNLQKTFDAVDHNILLHKLSHYGTRNSENGWFSYIFNRKQFVTIKESNSQTQIRHYGTTQNIYQWSS